jgi:hypothetical protein
MEKETGNTRGDDTLAAAASVPTDKATSPAFMAMMFVPQGGSHWWS